MSTSSLWRWLARARRDDEVDSAVGELVEIPLAALSARAASVSAVTMQITGGTRLEVAVGTDPSWIGALVRALTPASE